MRAFLGLWTAAMLLTAGFGAAGTSPERLIRVIYADAYGAAQVLDGRASLAAQWTEDALRAVWASGTQGLFPTTLGKGAHTRLPGWSGNDSRRAADPIRTSLSRAAASPYIENLRLMGLLAIRRTARMAVYFLCRRHARAQNCAPPHDGRAAESLCGSWVCAGRTLHRELCRSTASDGRFRVVLLGDPSALWLGHEAYGCAVASPPSVNSCRSNCAEACGITSERRV